MCPEEYFLVFALLFNLSFKARKGEHRCLLLQEECREVGSVEALPRKAIVLALSIPLVGMAFLLTVFVWQTMAHFIRSRSNGERLL